MGINSFMSLLLCNRMQLSVPAGCRP